MIMHQNNITCSQLKDVRRVQKRLLHLVSQQIELSLVNGIIEISAMPYRLATEGNGYKAVAEVRLDKTMTRSQTANVVRAELIRRFLAKPSGFVCGKRHGDNADLKGTTANNSIGTQAAAQWVTAYFASTQQTLLKKFSQQKFLHMSYFHDASKVCTFEAMCFDKKV